MKEQEVLQQAEAAIRECLDGVPFLTIQDATAEAPLLGGQPDLVVHMQTPLGQRNLVVEVKASGQPLIARGAIEQLRGYCEVIPNAYPVLLAPYISDATARLCEKRGVGYVDLVGNCRLNFDQVYVEQRGRPNQYSERRELRSLYSPKSERILRVLLNAPRKAWKVQDLAKEAQVSIGLVSKAKRTLELREWLDGTVRGLKLKSPLEVLTEWAESYCYAKHLAMSFYSLGSGLELEEQVVAAARNNEIRVALTGFSAAARYAPAVRYLRSVLYCEATPVELARSVSSKPVSSGADLTLIQPYDEGVFYGVESRDGLPVASPIQTYLDLMKQPARGEEAAEALLREVIQPSW